MAYMIRLKCHYDRPRVSARVALAFSHFHQQDHLAEDQRPNRRPRERVKPYLILQSEELHHHKYQHQRDEEK
jgi:hypothetical protein